VPDFSDPQSLKLILALIVPGLIITYFRTQFTTGRMQKHSDAILAYFTLSAIYGAIVLPILNWLRQGDITDPMGVVFWFLLIFLGPMIFGVVLGLVSKTEIIRRLLHKISINPIHTMPTAWDWKFGNMKEQLVLVTLKNDTQFAGYCGQKSFMSSEPSERDIYIQKIYGWGDNDSWIDGGEHGLWIACSEIRSIEFFPVSEEGVHNG
jgi:hypothetical protein